MSSIRLRNITSEQNLSIDGPLLVRYTQDATSSSDGGALTILGGLGVAKKVFVGGDLTLGGDLVAPDALVTTITSTRITHTIPDVSSPVPYISIHNDKLVLWSNTTLEVLGASSFSVAPDLNVSGRLSISNVTGTTGPGTGALTVSGGAGISMGLQVGTDLFVGGHASVSQELKVLSTIDSGDLATGSVTLEGGLAVRKNLRCGESIYVSDLVASGSLTCHDANLSGDLQAQQQVVFTALTSSTTSATNQAVAVHGGLGIGGNLFVSGPVVFTSTVDSINPVTGGLVISGGLGVAGNASIAGRASLGEAEAGTLIVSGAAETGSLTVRGAIEVEGGLTAEQGLIQNLTVQSGVTVVSAGLSVASGPTTLQTLSVQSGLNVQSGLTVESGILKVESGSTVLQGLTAQSVQVHTALEASSGVFAQDVSVGTLQSQGAVTLQSSLNAQGNITTAQSLSAADILCSGSLTVQGDLSAASAVSAQSLSVEVDAAVSGTLVVTGNVQVNDPQDAVVGTGAAALTVSGGSRIGKSLIVGNGLSVGGASAFANNIEVYGTLYAASTQDPGALVVAGGAGISKALSVGGAFAATGPTTLSTLSVAGSSSFGGSAGFADSLRVSGASELIGSVSLTGTLAVQDAVSVSGSMSVQGQLVLGSGAAVAGNVAVGGDFDAGTIQTQSVTTGTARLGDVELAATGPMLRVTGESVRIAASTNNSTTRQAASVALFTLGNSFADMDWENLSLVSAATDNRWHVSSRSYGQGTEKDICVHVGTTNPDQLVVRTDGNVSMSGSLEVSGGLRVDQDVVVGGSVTSYSDRRLKSILGPVTLTPDLSEMQHIQAVRYTMKASPSSPEFQSPPSSHPSPSPPLPRPNNPQIGFIAQDVARVFPELVRYDDQGTMMLAYDRMVAVLWEAVKVLQAEVHALSK
ncbi:hypothetical protein HK102_008325 [Quaeritorhiza haematococci]|nr:hypothetical protein HK102_008325 [Quaeritorhiza haematococci]